MRPLAVFDIDGVLADVSHRVHFLQCHPADWRSFFDAAQDDVPLPEGMALSSEAAKDCDVVYLTGRPERCRSQTEHWLSTHGFPQGPIVMRSDGDHRPARRAKPPLLRVLARGRIVAVVVDDDQDVCDAYVKAGWNVLQARWAGRSDALHQAQENDGRT